MLPSSREIIFHSAISRMSLADDSTLNIIDNESCLHKIDLKTLKILKSTSLSHTREQTMFDYYKRPFALGKNRIYLSFSQKGEEYIIDTTSKLTKITNFIYNGNTEVTKASFSENDKLLITGNEKGKTYIIDTNDGNIQAELPRSSDTITAVAISEEFGLSARASFSKTLVVYRTNSLKILFEKKLNAVVESITFCDQNTLLAIMRDGKILKMEIPRGKILKETILGESVWPSALRLSDSKKFVYIGTRESMLYALHVKTLDVLFQVKLPYLGVTTMVRTSKYFIFGFKTGEVVLYNHREFEDQFIIDIKLKKTKEASLIFKKNIFLMSHRETRYIYDYWLEQKEMIVSLLSKGEIEQATTLFEPFLFHPKCKFEFAELELLQPDLATLERCIRSLSFNAAYALANTKPALKKSFIFASMESQWNKSLQKAQILLSREPILNKEAAKDSLKLFWNVEEKKPIIENMLKRSGIFNMSELAIKDKNFALYFKLTSQNTFLELTPLYQKVLLLGERIQIEIVKHLEEKNYEKALELASVLFKFTPYQNQANRLREVSKALIVLGNYMEHSMLLEAVKLQDQFGLQTNYPLVEQLERMKKEFQSLQIQKIEEKNYSQVYAAVYPYMSIPICRNHVAVIMKKFYIAQFEDINPKTEALVDWEKTFEAYAELFSPDKFLSDFATKSNKIALFKELKNTINIENNIIYPKMILVKKSH